MVTCERGCSDYTPVKLDHIRKVIRMHLRMAYGARQKYRVSDYRYVFCDLNAGMGRFDCNGEPMTGSSLIFLQEAEAFGARYEAYLFERDRSSVQKLWEAVGPRSLKLEHGTVEIIEGDNLVNAPILAERLGGRLRGTQFGMVLADPYGTFNADAMRPLLEWGDDNRLDGVVSVATTAHKRNRERPVDELQRVGRPQLLIREPVLGADGGWNWTIAVLTKWAGFSEYKRIGLHRLDTPEGQDIAYRLNTTKVERADPKALGRIAPTRNTYGIPGFGQSVRMRSRGLEAAASDAAPGQLRFTT